AHTGAFERPTDTGAFRRPETSAPFGSDGSTYGAFDTDRGVREETGPGGFIEPGRTDRHGGPAPGQQEEHTTESSAASGGRATGCRQREGPANLRPRAPDPRQGHGSPASLSRRYGGAQGAGGTVVPPTPEGGSADSLPIFDAIESNWFKRRTSGANRRS